MAFRVMMFNYFFGSDTRSLGFLEIVNKKVPTIKVNKEIEKVLHNK